MTSPPLSGTAAIRPVDNLRRHTPGNPAVWVFVLSEMSEFAFFFIVFLVVKLLHPELFSAGPKQLNTIAGLANTLLLITSSWFVANAVNATRCGQQNKTVGWLALTIAAGLLYCVIKYLEYRWNVQHGISTRTNLFFSLYYYLAFNHLLHVLIGICVIGWALLQSWLGVYDSENHRGLEGAATYWHMIDLVWILLFPMLYIVG